MFDKIRKKISKSTPNANMELLNCTKLGIVNVYEKNGGKIDIHPTVVLNSNPHGYHVGMPFETTLLADRPNARITISENCRIHGTYIHATKSIKIGKKVLIAAGTTIVDSHGHTTDIKFAKFRTNIQDTPQEIIIEDFVWIGMNSIIMKGVRIGTCSIISAGAVVKDNVPPYCIVEGNPAKVIKQFTSQDILDESFSLELLKKEKGYYEY